MRKVYGWSIYEVWWIPSTPPYLTYSFNINSNCVLSYMPSRLNWKRLKLNLKLETIIELFRTYPKLLLENVEYFNYFGSMITNYARCTREIKSRTALAKAALNKKKTLFTGTLDLTLRNKLANWYNVGIAFYGAETWKLRKVDQKYLDRFEMWCWKRMEKINWIDRVRNEKVLHAILRYGYQMRSFHS